MLAIHLNNLCFHSFHGLYAEERITGNDFRVDLTVQHHPAALSVNSLEDTIDYVAVYQVVKAAMDEPRDLLETVAIGIANTILKRYAHAEDVSVSITKLYPPIPAIQGSLGVSFKLNRNQLV